MNKLCRFFNKDSYINTILIVGVLFQSYKLFEIFSFEMSLPMVFIIIADLLFIITITKLRKNMTNCISMIFIIYIVFNYLLNYKYSELTSMILSLFLVGSTILTYRNIEEKIFNKYINIYILIVTILSIYGIYQFVGRINNLPFTNLYFDGHMIKGFNWTNPIWISGKKFIRVNSIYREPSFYSQFTALGVILLISKFIKEKRVSLKELIYVIINLIGIILSFSGTGLIILGIYIIYAFLFEIKNIEKKIKIIFILSSVLIVLLILSLLIGVNNKNDIMMYFLNRLSEVFNNSGSGGIRFVGAFETLKESLGSRTLIGYGIGSRQIFFNKYALDIHGTETIDSTIPRIGVELGIIGIILWLSFLCTFINRNISNIYYRCILLFIFIQMFNGDYFLQITNWIFIYFINCKIQFINSDIENVY